MRALYWNGQDLELKRNYATSDEPLPGDVPGGGFRAAPDPLVPVRVHLAGICSTDLQIFKGYMGFTGVPGHEFVGTVQDAPGNLCGKRVVGEINFGCEACEYCRRGLTRHCPNRRVMGILNADGAFAEFVRVPAANLHTVPDTILDEEAVFTEPLAAAFEILEQVRIESGDRVLVLGDGKLGNLCAQVLSLTGADVTTLGRHERKLDLIRDLGIRAVALQDWTPEAYDVVVEATGSESALKLAMESVRARGTLVLKSTIAGEHRLSLAPLVINEVTVVGSRCGLFMPALSALEQKTVKVKPLIESVYPLDDGITAVARAATRGALKILINPKS